MGLERDDAFVLSLLALSPLSLLEELPIRHEHHRMYGEGARRCDGGVCGCVPRCGSAVSVCFGCELSRCVCPVVSVSGAVLSWVETLEGRVSNLLQRSKTGSYSEL